MEVTQRYKKKCCTTTPMNNKDLFQLFNMQFNKKIKVIVIHGPTTSGKTTFANNLYKCLNEESRTLKIHLDDYFRTVANEDYSKFDFDNPSVVDWNKVHQLIESIDQEEKFLPIYKFCFITRMSKGPFLIENIFPEILIIEGIYSMNIFSNYVFDIDKFNPTDSSREGYAENSRKYKNFGILNIKMVLCRKKNGAYQNTKRFQRKKSFERCF